MKQLIKGMAVIAGFLSLTFILATMTGVLYIEQIEGWPFQAKNISPVYLADIIILFADKIVAIPTMTSIKLYGILLGFRFAAITSFTGLFMAAILNRFMGKKDQIAYSY